MMQIKTAARWALATALVMAMAGCAGSKDGSRLVQLKDAAPSALVVVASAPVTSEAITAAVAGPARPREHLEVLNPAVTGTVLDSSVAPGSPTMAGPVPPKKPQADATSYEVDLYGNLRQAYEAKLAADRRTLEDVLAGRLLAWSSSVEAAVSRTPADDTGAAGVRVGLSKAAGFFTSLEQAGIGLGTRRVVVLLGTQAISDSVVPLPRDSLSGITVIITNFEGGEAAEAEWQADLLQAGANRAVVLSSGAANELAAVVAQGLDGESGPAPTEVLFGLNQANLDSTARTTLARLAADLIRACPNAAATVLGFADPLGSPARNALLAHERAVNTMAFLTHAGVPAFRLFASGYGTSLPAASPDQDGAQPLDRRAVVVIDPVSGQDHDDCGLAR